MNLEMHIVNAFAAGPFSGNPAAVIATTKALPVELMQQIAAQNNLSETAFVVTGQSPLQIRWFTPTKEVDLCGHATLASASVLFDGDFKDQEQLVFSSHSGELKVKRLNDKLQLDFPLSSRTSEPVPPKQDLAKALGCKEAEIEDCFQAKALVIVVESEALLASLEPNIKAVAALHPFAVSATAAGEKVDFVARLFAPNAGIDEDPVTGSAYTFLAPYWGERMGMSKLNARQISARGGEIECTLLKERVLIAGKCVDYLKGSISV